MKEIRCGEKGLYNKNCKNDYCKLGNLLDRVGPSENTYVFRSLTKEEVMGEKSTNRGAFPRLHLGKCNLYDIAYVIFDLCSRTTNKYKGKNSEEAVWQLYSYSKSLLIPLFKYHKNCPGIGFKQITLNVFSLNTPNQMKFFDLPMKSFFATRYSCDYINNSTDLFKGIPLEKLLGDNDIRELTIDHFNIDLSMLEERDHKKPKRETLDYVYDNCLKLPTIKRLASIGKDKEVIATIPHSVTPSSFIFFDPKKLNYLRFFIHTKLFLSTYNDSNLWVYDNNTHSFEALTKEEQERQRHLWKIFLIEMEKRLNILINDVSLFTGEEKAQLDHLLQIFEENITEEREVWHMLYNDSLKYYPNNCPNVEAAYKAFCPTLSDKKTGNLRHFYSYSDFLRCIDNYVADVTEMIESYKHRWE